jgi:TonB family protein
MVDQAATDEITGLTPTSDWRWDGGDQGRGWWHRPPALAAFASYLLLATLLTGGFDGALHSLFGVRFAGDQPRPIGDKAGFADGIAAEVIDAAELDRRYIAFEKGRAEADSRPEARPPPALKPLSEPDAEARDKPADGWAPSSQKATPEPQRERKPPQETTTASLPPVLSESEMKALVEQTMEDLQGGAMLVATPGAARLGEASPFVRGVIRILKRAMPRAPRGTRGEVVLRFLVGENGQVAALRILRPSGRPELDRHVAESVMRTALVAPPPGTPERERVFTITYDYR